MSKAIIEYKKPETLKMLKGIAKYLNFKISASREEKAKGNGLTITPGDETVDISGMEGLFSGRNLDAKELRRKAWLRTK